MTRKLTSIAQCKRRVAQLENELARERENHSKTFDTGKRLLDAFRKLVAESEVYHLRERASIAASAATKKRGRPRKPGGRTEQRQVRELGRQFLKEYDTENPPAWISPERHARFKKAKERILNPHPKIKPTRGKPGRPRDDKIKLIALAKVEAAKKRDGVNYDAPYLRKLSTALKIPVSTLKYWLRGARDLQR